MNEANFAQQLQNIRWQLAALRGHITQLSVQHETTLEDIHTSLLAEAFVEKIAIALDELQAIENEVNTRLEELVMLNEALLEQNEHLAAEFRQYRDLFEFAPSGYLITNARGVILKANCAAAQLLNVPQKFLVGKPLAVFIALQTRQSFRIGLIRLQHKLPCPEQRQEWKVCLQPRLGKAPFDAELTITVHCDTKGKLDLHISIRELRKYGLSEGVAELDYQLKPEQ